MAQWADEQTVRLAEINQELAQMEDLARRDDAQRGT